MYLDKAKKEEIFAQYGKEHVKQNRKDYVTTRSLTQLVGKRRALLDYLYDRDIERYRAIVKALGLRK